MNKCLITKLDAIVNNDALMYFDKLVFNCVETGNSEPAVQSKRVIRISGIGNFIVTHNEADMYLSTGALITNPYTAINPSTLSLYPQDVNNKFMIDNKYELTALTIGPNNGFNSEQLQGCDKLQIIDIEGKHINGGLSNYALPNLTMLTLQQQSNLNGDIAILGKCTKLTFLNVNGTLISGTLENLAETIIANETTSHRNDTLRINGNYIVKYNGTSLVPPSGKIINFTGDGNYTITTP